VDLRQLRYFVAVAEEQSFTRASRRLHVTQQTVSASIAGLERQLGCQLLERTGRSVELTAAGQSLLDAAPAVSTAIDAALCAVHASSGELRGELRSALRR
jgi:DNA-binding transcriptional LysR family regulator